MLLTHLSLKEQIFYMLFAIVMSAFVLFGVTIYNYSRIWEAQVRSTGETDSHLYKRCCKISKKYAVCFMTIGLMLWGTVFILSLPMYMELPSTIKSIVEVGIHIPLLFIIVSRFISFIFKQCFSTMCVSNEDVEDCIIVLFSYFDICLFILNIRIAVFMLAILLGKFIWLDFRIEGIKGAIIGIKNHYQKAANGSPLFFSLLYARFMLVETIIMLVIMMPIRG